MMRPNRARAWDRALVGVSIGAILAGTITTARAEVLTTDGVFMPPGSTAKAFGGAFCRQGCTAVGNPAVPWGVAAGADKLGKAVAATPAPVTLLGFSLGAVVVDDQLARWAAKPQTAPTKPVTVVTLGNPNNRLGGSNRDRVTVAPVQQYDRLEVVAQYDRVADTPARFGWYSQINLSMAQHMSYNSVDIDDPDHLVYRDGSTTHMLVEADVLPMLRWRQGFTSPERMAQLDAKYRPLVERDYDRPTYVRQGEDADWANGVEPEALRESDDVEPDDPEETSRSGRGDGNEQSDGTESSGAAAPSRSADQDGADTGAES